MNELKNTGPLFVFFDSAIDVLLLGRKSDNKIFFFDYNEKEMLIKLNNQIFPISDGILSICSVPRKYLNECIFK